MSFRAIVRNLIEYVAIVAIWWLSVQFIQQQRLPTPVLTVLVLIVAWAKTLFFGIENLRQLWEASQQNMAYHRFMILMLVNMSQIILSFGLDYHVLDVLDPQSLGSINPDLSQPELVFECMYFSVLNFTFFGYGDITPQTVPAKLLTMTEILLAFITVIFLLSDFISLKESIAKPRVKPTDVSPKQETLGP